MAINGVSEDEAREQMKDAAEFKAQLAAITAAPATATPPADDPEDYSDMLEELDVAIEEVSMQGADPSAIRSTLEDLRARLGPVNAR
jgi:hypothetical protein